MIELSGKMKRRLLVSVIAYMLVGTLLGGVIGIAGYVFLKLFMINMLVRKIFVLVMVMLGFLSGFAFSLKCLITLCDKQI